MILNFQFLKDYLSPTNKRHLNYAETVKLADQVRVHSDGDFATKLITERRPGESDRIKEYRALIHKSPTRRAFGKVVTELNKIRKAEQWMVKYDEKKLVQAREGETLFDYCEKTFPLGFKSITNWVFSVFLKSYLVDPNALIFVKPIELPDDKSDYLRPFPYIFHSSQVLDYKYGEYAVLLSSERATYEIGGKKFTDGLIYYLVDKKVIQKYSQADNKGTYTVEEWNHELEYMPVFMIGGAFYKANEDRFIYQSRLSDALPSWDEAVREYSDLQAEVVQHIHSLMWSFSNQPCSKCTAGKVQIKEGKGSTKVRFVDCEACGGSGFKPFNPYEHLSLRPASNTEQPLPTPFIGYVTKDTAIAELQDKRVRAHVFDGLSAINMEFLAKVPLAESGIAKDVDRDALNTYVSAIAEDIVNDIDILYKIISDYRYSAAQPNKDKRDEQLPRIPVPQKFDLLSSNYLIDELEKAKNQKLNPGLITALEIEYANAKFNSDEAIRDMLLLIHTLDPLSGIMEDDKMSMLQNRGITEIDYIISSNISYFIKRAVIEAGSFEKFAKLSYDQQRRTLEKYAMEVKNSYDVQPLNEQEEGQEQEQEQEG